MVVDPRTLGEQWGDERWGPPGIRREQQKPKPEFQDWDGFCLTGDPLPPDTAERSVWSGTGWVTVAEFHSKARQDGEVRHLSSCALHREPLPPNTQCDCGAILHTERAHGYLGPQVDDGA